MELKFGMLLYYLLVMSKLALGSVDLKTTPHADDQQSAAIRSLDPTLEQPAAISSLDPTLEQSAAISSVSRRQAPWFLPPQPYLTIPLFHNFRGVASWGLCTCPIGPSRTYLPPAPTAAPLPSDFDDPNDVLDRIGGGGGGIDDRAKPSPSPREPTRCTWAIVACCSPGSRDIRYSCFELLGCPGAFWDVNPCDEKVVMAAANSALNFYSAKTNATSNSNE
ncbi:uncharacterized protein LOC111060552 isoform X2 [Nilaparvata lugens]|nr:uncharacterized protein LOC111060552 isoform X2 [Nilaparvata lugens]XP_039275852.1 uncharacterized protein LOC111060552 isoform X2 [Nilaparvata lugens]XP_039275853.1 uncharacterized protein LOC111060552 isoform X2 [Nilaparvata lugens]